MKQQELKAERDWILDAENIAVVRACRREIQEEFGERLSLERQDLLQTIDRYARESQNPHLRRLVRPIVHHLVESAQRRESDE